MLFYVQEQQRSFVLQVLDSDIRIQYSTSIPSLNLGIH